MTPEPEANKSGRPTDVASGALLGHVCEIHTAKEIAAVNTCPVCLYHVHKHTCEELKKYKSRCLYPHPDGGLQIGKHKPDKDGYCIFCGMQVA